MSGDGDVKAKVRYTIHVGDGMWYIKDNPSDSVVIPGESKEYEVTLHNARGKQTSIHKEGFILNPHDTKVSDFYSEEEVKNIYFPEIEQILLKQFPDASRVFVFDHTRRASSKEIREVRKDLIVRPTALNAHADYSVDSATKRVRDFFPEDAENILKKRFLIVNVWRPTVRTVETLPLGLMDARTVVMDDFLTIHRIEAGGRVGQIQHVKHSDRHKWYYFPKMERNEVAIFKTYDSHVEEGLSRFTPHCAAVVDGEPENVPPRESIEVRSFVFFD